MFTQNNNARAPRSARPAGGAFQGLENMSLLFSRFRKPAWLLLVLWPVMTGVRAWAADEQPEYGRAEAAAEQAPELYIDSRELLQQLEKEIALSSRQELREALRHYKAGELPEAIGALEGLLERDPTVMTAWDFLGQAYWKAGRPADAFKLWGNLKVIKPDFFPLYNWTGRGHMLRGDYPAAIEAFRASLRLQPIQDRDNTKLNLARLLRWSGNLEEAITMLRPLHQVAPQNQSITRDLASALLSNREYDEALPLWSALQAGEPTNLFFLAKEAVALLHTGHITEAVAGARRVLAEDPNSLDALRIMADETQFHGAQREEALVWLRRMIDQTTAFKLKRQLSLRYVFLYTQLKGQAPERFPLARPAAMLGQLVEADPFDVDVIMAYAEVLSGDQRYAEARQQLERVLKELNPNSVRAQNNLFEMALEEKKFPEALAHYEQRAAFNPADPYLHYMLARWHAAQGRYPAAHRELDQLEAAGRRGAVAVLLYHGLSSSENGEVLPVARLREQLAGLKQAGFRFIAAHELPAYFARCAKLAATLGEPDLERVACVTFDDARRDSMRYGTPLGTELKIPFSMHVPVGYVLQRHPFICTWEMLREYQQAGCWHFGGHTLYAHDRVPIDAAQRLGFALPNHLWLAPAQRLETDAEYAARLTREYDECHDLLIRQLGHTNECNFFAYPFGDIGQITRNNDSAAPRKNLEHAARSYAVGFIQTGYGYAVAGDHPLLLQRYEPDRNDSAEAVLEHVLDRHPVQLARRLRAQFAALEDKRHLLLGTLRAMQKDGYPEPFFQKLVLDLEGKLGRHIPVAEIERAEPAAPVKIAPEAAQPPPKPPEKPVAVVMPAPAEKPVAPSQPRRRPADFEAGRSGLRDLHNPLK